MITIYLKHYESLPRKQIRKTEHALGLSLLSKGLLELHHLDIPANSLSAHLSFTEHEKPYLKEHPDIFYNISHCTGLVVCAFSDRIIGVDVEEVRSFNENIIRKVLTEEEKAYLASFKDEPTKYEEMFYRFWTLKESRIKHSGLGLAMPLTDFSFRFDLTGSMPNITCSDPHLYFHQQILEQRYVLSVCSSAPIENVKLLS